MVTNMIIGTYTRCADYWEAQELCIPNTELPLDQERSDGLQRVGDSTIAITSPSTESIYVAIHYKWGTQYIW